jgi:nitrous oxide reductase family maturation protein NosD
MVQFIRALILIVSVLAPVSALAKTFTVSPGSELSSITEAIESAGSGDTIEVHGGTYKEHIVVDKTLSLIGVGNPRIDGGGKGTIVTIKAPGTVFSGFRVTGSGESLSVEHAGIVVENSPGSIIADNNLDDVLFGIYFKNSPGSVIENNTVLGKDLPLPKRGDGIRLWYNSDTKILGNRLTRTRDLVMWWSGNTQIKGNTIEKGRYGLHYMYSNNNLFEDNVFIDNYVGGFLMYSGNITFYNNIFARNQGPATGYGVGFKDLDDITAEGNLLIDNRIGLYLDNSPHLIDSWNTISENVIAFNDIGVSFMPSIERNLIVSNSFIDNTEQIEVRGGGTLSSNKWYEGGKGNYWSDYAGYDEDGDGVGEIPYKAESLFENLIDANPNLRLFIFSPVAQAIEFAAEAFPVIKPEPKVVDSYPLINPRVPERYRVKKSGFAYSLFFSSFVMVLIPVCAYLYLKKK